MGQSLAIPRVIPEDWKRLDLIINKIRMRLGRDSSPTFAELTLTGLTASSLLQTDANKTLISIALPLIVAKGGTGATTLTDHGILLGSGVGAITPLGVASNGQLPIGSTGADPILATISGTTDHISVANGAGSITLDLDTNTQTLLGSFNGIFLEKLNFTISEDAGTVTGKLEQDGNGDLIQRFSDGYTTLDCTPAAEINLTAYVGSDAVPKQVFVYILQSAKTVITASNSDWPATEHIKIANLLLKSATTTGTDGGALVNRNWNDPAFGSDSQGHLTHVENRIRQEPSQWDSGIALTLKNSAGTALTTSNSSTAVEIVLATGKVYQLHKQTFPAFDMYVTATDKIQVVNQPTDEGGAYETTVDLVSDITHYVDGTAAGVAIGVNKYFNLVVWGVQNRSGEASHVMINLPTGQYTTSANAVSDVDGTSIFTIPSAFKGIGFLIARLTFRLIGGAQWTYVAQEDLRGKFPDIIAGVGITTTDHALLANLIAPADDHTQYLLASGTRALAGAWDMGSQALTNVNIDSGVITGITDLAVADGGTGASTAGAARTNLGLVIGTDVQAYDAGLLSLAGLTYTAASFVKMTGANTFALRTIGETADDLQGTIDHDLTANFVANKHIDWTSTTENINTTGTVDASGFQIIAVFAQVDIQSTGNRAIIICDGSTGNDADIIFQENHASEWVIKHDSSDGSKLKFIQKPGDDIEVLVLRQDGSVVLPNGPLFIKEQAAADGDTAAYGQLWVKNDAPNTLWFTDDAGNDHQLATVITNRDTANPDWEVGDFTIDGTWHDLDISGEVPVGCTECWVKAFYKTETAERSFGVRGDGRTNTNAGFFINSQVANITNVQTLGPVKVVGQTIEYYVSNAVTTTLNVTIIAYRV